MSEDTLIYRCECKWIGRALEMTSYPHHPESRGCPVCGRLMFAKNLGNPAIAINIDRLLRIEKAARAYFGATEDDVANGNRLIAWNECLVALGNIS